MPALDLKARVLGSHLFFFREGDAYTVPGAGTCGAESKPDANDPDYINLGPIEDWEDDVSGGSDLEIWRPSPGNLVLKDIIEIKAKMMVKATTGEMSALAIESFYRSATNIASLTGQFNPLSGTLKKGWLHGQRYDHENNLVFTFDLWGRLKVSGGMKSGGELVRPQFEFAVLYSSLNTAQIGE